MTLEFAARVEARRQAAQKVKAQLRGQGLKPAHIPAREISALANAYLAEHRAELIAEARERVERWGLVPAR